MTKEMILLFHSIIGITYFCYWFFTILSCEKKEANYHRILGLDDIFMVGNSSSNFWSLSWRPFDNHC